MTTVGMGANKPEEDTRTDSAVKKENKVLKNENAELSAQVEALTAENVALKANAEQTDKPDETSKE